MLHYVRISFQHALLEMGALCFRELSRILSSPRRPKFELVMNVKDEIVTEPGIGPLSEVILKVCHNYVRTMMNYKCVENLYFLTVKSMHRPHSPILILSNFTKYVNFVLDTRQDIATFT